MSLHPLSCCCPYLINILPHQSLLGHGLILSVTGSPPAPEAWGGRRGGVEERAGAGADAHGQHDP